ncbi:DUF721 domain-containing protein [Halomonas sp. THAF12]|uniref:DUF721 domain-containing protein n=1 Tax=Halomonas sp. B23F22_10 TaxID=3459515 RepID=UPI00373E5F8C
MSRLLDGRGELGDLMRRARLIDRAQCHLRDHLPAELGDHMFVGGFHQGRLTVITDRAVWLTRLRYEQARLLALLHELPGFSAVTGFDFKVRPVRPPKAPVRQTRRLPASAADELTSCAEDVTDPRLKSALERLASHAEREP